jgi:hypothetical protein
MGSNFCSIIVVRSRYTLLRCVEHAGVTESYSEFIEPTHVLWVVVNIKVCALIVRDCLLKSYNGSFVQHVCMLVDVIKSFYQWQKDAVIIVGR